MGRVLLTGVTGFIGKHLAKRLCQRKNLKVVCLVRRESDKEDIASLERLGVELRYGDLRDAASISGLCQDIDTVVHLAAKVKGKPHEEPAFYDANVRATENFVRECKKSKVKKLIHMSTVGIYGPVENASEETPLNPSTAYEKTKAEAERVVLSSGLNYVIVRCGSIFGPQDRLFRLAFKLADNGVVPLLGNADAKIQPLFVNDLVGIIEKIMDRDIRNETVIAAGDEQLTLKDFIRMMAGQRRILFVRLPRALCSLLCKVGDALEQMLSVGVLLDSKRYDMFTRSRTFDISRLKRIVRPRFTPLRTAVAETSRWYRTSDA